MAPASVWTCRPTPTQRWQKAKMQLLWENLWQLLSKSHTTGHPFIHRSKRAFLQLTENVYQVLISFSHERSTFIHSAETKNTFTQILVQSLVSGTLHNDSHAHQPRSEPFQGLPPRAASTSQATPRETWGCKDHVVQKKLRTASGDGRAEGGTHCEWETMQTRQQRASMTTRNPEHRKNHSAVCFQTGNFMVCEFYLNKKRTGWFRTHSREKGQVGKDP